MTEYSMNSKDFYKALDSGELIGSKCLECGAYTVPQRQICPKCHSDQTEIVTFSGMGKLAAYTVISVPPVKMAQAGYNGNNPYCVGIVTLDEGPRVSAQILDVDLHQPEKITIGTDLVMTTIKRDEGEGQTTYLAFKPTQPEG
jgi:uncharacterized protein